MQVITINARQYKTRVDIESFLAHKHLKRGDKVEIVSSEKSNTAGSLIILLAAFMAISNIFTAKQKHKHADEILDTLIESHDLQDLAKRIKDEFDINIELTYENNFLVEDRLYWQSIGQQSFQKAYATDEPEYTNANILEPNPEYKA